jgi:hypothetical protein
VATGGSHDAMIARARRRSHGSHGARANSRPSPRRRRQLRVPRTAGRAASSREAARPGR